MIFRQTILLSSYRLAECEALFAISCRNYEGLVEIVPASKGVLERVSCYSVFRLRMQFWDGHLFRLEI